MNIGRRYVPDTEVLMQNTAPPSFGYRFCQLACDWNATRCQNAVFVISSSRIPVIRQTGSSRESISSCVKCWPVK